MTPMRVAQTYDRRRDDALEKLAHVAIARHEQRILLLPIAIGELIFNQDLSHAGVLFFRLPGARLQSKIKQ
jgi:hypothetical protein